MSLLRIKGEVYPLLQVFLGYRRSGSNRHGALAPPDFESSLPCPSLFYCVGESGLCKVDTRLQQRKLSNSVWLRSIATAVALLPRLPGLCSFPASPSVGTGAARRMVLLLAGLRDKHAATANTLFNRRTIHNGSSKLCIRCGH